MRPIEKGEHPLTRVQGKKMVLTDYKKAIPVLKNRTGLYCHICEMRSPFLAIEHIKPQDHFPRLISHWDNFLLVCTYCNSRKLETIPLAPYRKKYFWPHLNNTLLAFKRNIFGLIEIDPQLSTENKKRAENLISLYKLDKAYTEAGDSDTRWKEQASALLSAIQCKKEYTEGQITISAILREAVQHGFFSVWFKVFSDIFEVKKALVEAPEFHLNPHFFDANYNPIPRNTNDI